MAMNIIMEVCELTTLFLLYCLIVFICSLINAHSNAEKVANLGDIIKSAVSTSVTYVNQTLVDKLKKEGQFTIDKQSEVLNVALDRCKILIDKNATEYIKQNFGDETIYLKTLIEAEVKKQKETMGC